MIDGLERLFVGDTGENSALNVHCSGLLGDKADDTWEASACSLFKSSRRQLIQLIHSFTQKLVSKRPFISDTGESSAHSLLRSPERQSTYSECAGLARMDFAQFPLWEGVVVLKGQMSMIYTLGGCGGTERTDFESFHLGGSGGCERTYFGQFSFWENVKVLKKYPRDLC